MTASPNFLDVFEQLRPRLFGIGYRMLGDAHEAEDLVQECWLRWQGADRASIIAPEGWLVTVMTRLAIDRLHRAESERLTYIGPWLPEPIATNYDDAAPSPDRRVEQDSDLSMAFLLLLERLGPEERAAFLLRELFDTDYDEIARIIDRTPATARQMVHRARERVRDDRARFSIDRAAHEKLLARFLDALHAGDQEALLSLFEPAATFASDGGGKVSAARRRVIGAERIARLLIGFERKGGTYTEHRPVVLNGEPAIASLVGGKVYMVTVLATDGERIAHVYRVLNPDKLTSTGLPVLGAMGRREHVRESAAGSSDTASR
ncbi:MAG: RNA polymerase sigma factor SigJ [Gemmatimonadaceae bacterium]